MPHEKKVPATVPTDSNVLKRSRMDLSREDFWPSGSPLLFLTRRTLKAFSGKECAFSYGKDGTPYDGDKARTYLSASAKLNHAEAQFELCVLLGEYDQWQEAVDWLEKAVSLGFGPAQEYLADVLSNSLIADHLNNKDDYSKSQLYRQAVAWYERRASGGDAEAQYDFASWLNRPDCPMHNRTRQCGG